MLMLILGCIAVLVRVISVMLVIRILRSMGVVWLIRVLVMVVRLLCLRVRLMLLVFVLLRLIFVWVVSLPMVGMVLVVIVCLFVLLRMVGVWRVV